jgi:hypothetical protein
VDLDGIGLSKPGMSPLRKGRVEIDSEAKSKNGTLFQSADDEQSKVMYRRQRIENGMDGARFGRPERPNDPVTYKLLDAAGHADF